MHLVDIDANALALKCNNGFTPVEILLSRCTEDDDERQYETLTEYQMNSFDNEIRDTVLPYMMRRFPGTELHLQSSLTDTSLGTRTMEAFMLAPNLQSLDVTTKNMTKEGLVALLRQLRSNHTLQELSVSWLAHIDMVELCRAFHQVFQHNTTLKKLYIRSRLLSSRELQFAQRALDIGNNTTLTTLELYIVPEYKLYLLMGSLMDDRSRQHRVDRTELDMKLALNRAQYHAHLESSTAVSQADFLNLLQKSGDSTSAHYVLLKSWPHLWSRA